MLAFKGLLSVKFGKSSKFGFSIIWISSENPDAGRLTPREEAAGDSQNRTRTGRPAAAVALRIP